MAKQTAERATRGVDLSGKTALVTGINSGIGFETMRVLALRGAHVLGTARTLEKASEACARIPGENTPLECELTDLDSIRECVMRVTRETPELDIVVANAGIMALPKLEQVRGIEKQFATNHLGHFKLLTSLQDRLTARSRVAVVSSAAHAQAPASGIDFDNLSGENGYSPWRAYGQSKLANILFANAFAERVPDGCTVNSLHPGIIQTNLGRNMQGPLTWMMGLVMWPFMSSIEQGAATSCYVVANPATEGVTAKYFADCAQTRVSSKARDHELGQRLWEVSEQLTN
ncbi:MAG: SDR family oxidoreductase [Pseudomonadales bacterium]|jgi:WW domain-containing oxidoreductase|nr:SDR family oxidoreductase [Pseudomonadales bacterium]MDP6829304.1 SDR family oxidoreductase [Pseudomonadales bacterium]|tara:strand:- start:47 stop:910 length:864 start_codon:yes stop_codon:yes gene_type:complete